jgi:flagellar capping protein FliD
MMISRVGLQTTEENIQNYQRDPTLVEKFWNNEFVKKYNELMKYLRRSKIKFLFQEKFKPAFNKNRNNEIVDNFG